MKKTLLSFILICVISQANVGNVSACSDEVQTRAPACVEAMYYKPTTTSTKTIISDTGKIINKSNGSISKTITYSTTVSSKASTEVTAEFNAITAKVGAKALVGFKKSQTKTVSTMITVKANSTATYSLGHQNKVTSGKIIYRTGGCVETSKNVSANYSFRYYDEVK